jgi:hypothetical protein
LTAIVDCVLRKEPDAHTGGAPQRMAIQEAGETPAAFNRITEFRPATTQLAEYAGYYASEEIDPVYRIVVDDSSLRLNRLKSRPEMLTPLAKDYFEGLGGVIYFPRDSGGKITGFVLNSESTKNLHFRKTAQM